MSIQSSAFPFVFVDYSTNPIDALAKDIFNLKDNLSYSTTIWCESRADIHTIRQKLIQQAQSKKVTSFELPTINTLQDWVWQQATPDQAIINETNKQLILVDAIRQGASIFTANNAWVLAKELISLFNECTLAQIPLEQGEEHFQELLSKGYGLANSQNISRESEIVYKLWLAYQEQIKARHWVDPIDYYCQWLANANYDFSQQHFYVVGKHRICASEAVFFSKLSESLKIYYPYIDENNIATHKHPHLISIASDQNKNEKPLDIIFSKPHDTLSRIEYLRNYFADNPFSSWLGIFTTNSAENHVRAVCLQAKKWLLEEKYPIGIVANNRLLIRRIRAVLEEEGIRANDLGGWALSTTSAATSIEVLLDAVEKEFHKDTLLDLLSSPFLPHSENPEYEQQFHLFKKQLKKHRSLSTDSLDIFIELTENNETKYNDLTSSLLLIKESCDALTKLMRHGEHELHIFSNILLNTITGLGIKNCLQNDIAGKQLIETLESTINSTRNNGVSINWKEWRQWLRNLLESHYFIPTDTDKRITLCGFEHIDNTQFDYVIFAGTEEKRLISRDLQRTFFNEKVRHELNLKTSQETNAINFVRFRQLLEQSKNIVLTAELVIHGEPQELCSWVTLIELFSQQAYSHSLHSSELAQLLSHYKNYNSAHSNVTTNYAVQPKPHSPAELVPRCISATQYQSLIDCPYQYFAKYILELRDQDQSDEFEASDFGQLVHQALNIFHFDEENKSGIVFASNNRDLLINSLTTTSTEVFNQALFPKSVKQGWLQRWITNIPAYIDWSIERVKEWNPILGEQKLNNRFSESIEIEGRIDRIDSNNLQHAIIDFKTGTILPSKKSIMNGEVVQLPFYALLDIKIAQAEYISLGTQGIVKSQALIYEDELSELKHKNSERLNTLLSNLLNQSELPAAGTENICKLCDYEGLCRKSHWES